MPILFIALMFILALLFILITITALVRFIGCIGSSEYRNRVKRRPIFHAIWAISAILIFAFVIYPFLSYPSSKWPKIGNPKAFYQECVKIVELNQQNKLILDRYHCLAKDKYPPEIQKIKPVSVFIRENQVHILISGGGIGRGWGYVVDCSDKDGITNPSKHINKYETDG